MNSIRLLLNKTAKISDKKNSIKLISAAIITLSISLPHIAQANSSTPKNIIYVIADGMGVDYATAYRFYRDDLKTPVIEPTIFDKLHVGISATHAQGTQDNRNRIAYVTDSAAAGTALSSGFKTYNGAIGIDVNNKPVETLMQYAKKKGKKTALVVNAHINHATPAAFVAHTNSRHNYDEIANQFYDSRINGKFIVDLMFGGGQKYFIRDDRNIVAQFIQSGYQYYDSYEKLNQFNRLPALGLFADQAMGYVIDNRQHKNRLPQMVDKALELLNQDQQNGFFLMIESSLIDWCGHENDIACTFGEMDELAVITKRLKTFIDNNPDTLMILTSDHETGGLSVGANNVYDWHPQRIKQIRHSINHFTQELLKNADVPVKILWQNMINIDVSKEQLQSISEARDNARQTIRKNRNLDEETVNDIISEQRVAVIRLVAKIVSDNTLTGWTSFAHTGGDVNVYAYGKHKSLFNGYQDNVDIAKKLFKLLGKTDTDNIALNERPKI